jgi:hypothetical protein
VNVGRKHCDRRFREQTIQPGDDVYLLGYAEAREGASRPLGPEDVVVTTPDDELLILSNRSEEELTDELSSRFVYFWAAVGCFVLGIAILLGYF